MMPQMPSPRSESKRLFIIGATNLGVSHGVYRLLDKLGCRWFFPAKEWQVIQSRPDLAIDVDIVTRPALLARCIWYGYAFFDRNSRRPRAE